MKKMALAAAVLAATVMVSCGKKEKISLSDLEKVTLEKCEKNEALENIGMPTNKVDSLSYLLGMTQTEGLKKFLADVQKVDTTDMEQFYKGMIEYMNAKDDKKELAYILGIQIAAQLDQNLLRVQDYRLTGNDSTEVLSRKLFLAAFINKVEGKKLAMSMDDQEAMMTAQRLQGELADSAKSHWQKKNAEWLNGIAKKKGVKKLSDNLYYEVITEGKGEIPNDSSTVKVNYEGKLIDGTVFDSSYERKEPVTFNVNQVIPGWTEALTHMPVGSKWKLYIGQEKGYGAYQAGSIRPFSALEFTVELLGIEAKEEEEEEAE